ncbi:sugar ABC transporter permease [Pseudomonas syringae pv. tomato]|uniref:Sugar ABC transporter permease n=2 Tax=Pseudomonas syringae group TaxID=136849 RepID=A0AB36KWQ6_PSEUB|nr:MULTISPECIES: ABC transporter permease [Pseudomonas syringae group]KPB77641.1 Inner-membrane translocator [Pseudomonas syringae pv. maculicola]KPW53309.1 Inner-membrane translocator [Pseudomonas syringae pv. berberidis]KPY26612.1 Inner-membrane translocator [Pseudomonas syringae pv. philadelphi]MBI6847685.1 ABC transporter permease [Pseudomonas syringae]MBX6506828.1 ABC transporter permease [Pseudomonas syringae pv. tomato]
MSESIPSIALKPARGDAVLRFIIHYGLLLVLVLVVLLFSIAEPAFLRVGNLFIILQSLSIVALLALGVTLSMSVGGMDLSIGAVAAMSVMCASYVMVVLDWGPLAAIFISLACGALVGLFNGFLIVRMGIPDILATLGTMFLIIGVQLIPTGGRSIAVGMTLPNGDEASGSFSAGFLALGRARLWDTVPVPVLVMAVVALLVWGFLELTRFGRVFYAIGGNERAARLAGAPVEKYKLLAYVLSALLASLGGLLLAARLGRGDVSSGNGLVLDALGAALIGFAVLGARKPNAFGTLVGALLVATLLNGLTMLNAPYYTQDFVKGAVLVLALMFTFGLAQRAR